MTDHGYMTFQAGWCAMALAVMAQAAMAATPPGGAAALIVLAGAPSGEGAALSRPVPGAPGGAAALIVLAGAPSGEGAALSRRVPGAPGEPTALRMDAVAAPLSAAAQNRMIAIAGGAYPLGAPRAGKDAEPHRVLLEPFAIDRTEVTNGQFAEFLNALRLKATADADMGAVRARHLDASAARELLEGPEDAHPLIALDDEQARIMIRKGRFLPAPGFEHHPVSESTWRGARDYCAWRGARLPSEAEWEAAARGTLGRRYPWGNEPPSPERAYFGFPSGQTAPVGSRPKGATPEGVLDLAGSMAEWTSSLYRPYPYDPRDGRDDLSAAGERVTRGGDYVFDVAPEKLMATFRGGFSRRADRGHRHIGFRCANSPPAPFNASGGVGPENRRRSE
jgi:iron(II)-dependent oxidoreductase